MNDSIKRNLIVVDYQYDFADPKGSLYVPFGSQIWKPITNLLKYGKFDLVVATKDMHPADHCSFIENGGTWPSHCVAGTYGQEIVLAQEYDLYIDYVLHKGRDKCMDSYSAFFDNDKVNNLGLGDLIRPRNGGVGQDERYVYICGLALDYCVKFTALDAILFSSNVFIVSDAVRAVEQDDTKLRVICNDLASKGVQFISSKDIINPQGKGE